MRTHRRGGVGASERGAIGIEFALAMPVVFILLFMVAELTGVMRSWIILENASREGARMGAQRKLGNVPITQTTVQNAVYNAARELPSTNRLEDDGSVSVSGLFSPTNPVIGGDVTVVITYSYEYRTPLRAIVRGLNFTGVVPDTMNLRASTKMRLE